jgi:hypothetical protein
VLDLTFFINLPFTLRSATSADNSHCLTALGMRYDQKLAGRRLAKGDQSFLSFRMVGVGTRRGKRVIENARCFVKRNLMFAEILRSLCRVPFKLHALILYFQRIDVQRSSQYEPSPPLLHSSRNALIGSTRLARRAGRKLAKRAATTSIQTIVAKVRRASGGKR